MSRIVIDFSDGLLLVDGFPRTDKKISSILKYDDRSGVHCAPADSYPELLRYLVRESIPFSDQAKEFRRIDIYNHSTLEPRDYQKEALGEWKNNKGKGVVVLPTGSGKSLVATLAIVETLRSTLVIVPTLDLMRQWSENLRRAFQTDIGLVGGGEFDIQDITVTTYSSASIHMERIGNQFGLLIYDECHHLPSESNALAARMSIAPYRLGLTATPERSDGLEENLEQLVGPIVFKVGIKEMSGDYLADYETIRVPIELSESEREEYEAARRHYLSYVRSINFRFRSKNSWAQFVMKASRSKKGQAALASHRRQRQLAIAAPGKIDYVGRLLFEHRNDRAIVFTSDNKTAYEISRRFLIPIITHESKIRERKHILHSFSSGEYRAIATSKVLNEGVDVPDANVAIVVSGSSSVREHVQRLGRVLRKRKGKAAILYELITADTVEAVASERRRDHAAYRN